MNFQQTSLTLRNQKRLLLSVMQKKVAIKKLEKVTAFGNAKKVAAYNKKWDIKNRKLPLQSRLDLQRVFILQTKGLGGWFYF